MSRVAKHLKDHSETTVAEDGQIELTVARTPLYEASEKLVRSKARLHAAQDEFEKADDEWVEAMKESNKGKICHKGDTIQLVQGRTTKDHSRFTKS